MAVRRKIRLKAIHLSVAPFFVTLLGQSTGRTGQPRPYSTDKDFAVGQAGGTVFVLLAERPCKNEAERQSRTD